MSRCEIRWYTRLILSLGVALAGAVISALVLTILDLYLVGHGRPSIDSATIAIPLAGTGVSLDDAIFLGAIVVSGMGTWLLLGLATEDSPDSGVTK